MELFLFYLHCNTSSSSVFIVCNVTSLKSPSVHADLMSDKFCRYRQHFALSVLIQTTVHTFCFNLKYLSVENNLGTRLYLEFFLKNDMIRRVFSKEMLHTFSESLYTFCVDRSFEFFVQCQIYGLILFLIQYN